MLRWSMQTMPRYLKRECILADSVMGGNVYIFDKNPKLREVAMNLAKLGLYQRTVADWLGISEGTITNYKKVDEEFNDAFETGGASARAMCIAKLLEAVKRGSVPAAKYYLSMVCGLKDGGNFADDDDAEGARNVVNLVLPDNDRRNDLHRIEASAGTADGIPSDEG